MPDLVAQGPQPQQRWRKPLADEESLVIGRTTGVWATAWDSYISRQHVEVRWSHSRLEVAALPTAGNPVFFRGQRSERFALAPGEHFVIGSTTFSLVDDHARVSLHDPRPVTEKTFARQELRGAAFRRPDERIAALARLPDIIATSATSDELHSRLMNVMLSGIGKALSVALVRYSGTGGVEVLQWDRRSLHEQEFVASARLVQQAIESGQSVAHVWSDEAARVELTSASVADWAFCTPLAGPSSPGQALYATGFFGEQDARGDVEALRDDLKFSELAATTFSRLREAQAAERRLAGLAQFLSPSILASLTDRDWDEALAPREVEMTVMFCDLRGFTRLSEQGSHDLLALLDRVSLALGVMTRHILSQGGVIGDFHGDSVMGFWGWPLPQPDAARRACLAALAIQEEFGGASADSAGPLPADFKVGIGIATGRGVAGKIGSRDQVKITAFGPVVILAARLESLTKTFQSTVLVDADTVRGLAHSDAEMANRLRTLAPVLPAGFTRAVEVSELLTTAQLASFSPDYLAECAQLSDALARGKWTGLRDFCQRTLPVDPVRMLIANYLTTYDFVCPASWQGGLVLREK